MDLPQKRYFTIGEVSTLCDLKPHVLRYWEQEFVELRPNKRRGNRRYYRREDVQTILNIKHLLYDKGFTISGARAQLVATAEPPAQAPVLSNFNDSLEQRNVIRALLEEAKAILS